ncbi:metallophosphoesterase [Sphingomonas sp. RG327]|jgi:3',5'-cyclic AMP phosphodiesterase CpdA|uniref:Metallophosphoesterase n=1 Tax=Sphingomonas anseongensis TaxID=2908207 RepID=A0ABT0RDS3_9SPHN|nr:metallophosphoesterase [Sphingomonas anseongensis]MCL6678406.1 metallophosphoesterase [Sphingomonas anseongensis]
MPRLIHLSDLHFGAHDPRLVEGVERKVKEAAPDLVVISGDFTQRARTEQFQDACRFLERLRDAGHEVLAVPGNHDVPLYDVFRRFLSPLTRYMRYIDDTLCPLQEIPGATVLGINTARSLTFKDGRISEEQMTFIRQTFDRTDPQATRILVTHHPLFALQVGEGMTPAVGRSELALDAIGDAGVDMLLAGHNHHASIHNARELVTRAGPSLVIQAGTATSTRVREQQQSFNRIDIDGPRVTVTVESWNGSDFVAKDAQPYERDVDHWHLAAARADEPAH